MGSSRRPFLLLVLLVASVVPTASGSSQQHVSAAGLRSDFVRAMNEATQRKEESSRQASLMKRMLKNAKLVKNAFVTPTLSEQGERNLGNYGNWNYGYKNYYQQDDAYQQKKQNYYQQNNNEGDDAFAEYGGLNLTKYALKYLGCQNIHSFSDEMAEDEDTNGVLALNRFVMFRLCPKDECSNYNEMGCDYNFGEYTLPMEDYLATMQEYHIQQYQEYCQTCAQCMTGTGDFAQQNNRDLSYTGGGQYYYYNNNGKYYSKNYGNGVNNYNQKSNSNYYQANGNDDDGGNNNYQADAYNNYNAYADDEQFNNEDGANQNANAYRCVYSDVCSAYQDACPAEMFTDDNYMANSELYSDYFECAEFNLGGAVSYLGPHCRSDGFTIGIGIYEDEECSTYVGDVVNIQQATGRTFDDNYLSPYYPAQCISCSAKESYDLMTDDEVRDEMDGGLYEVCGVLYQQAAKCNIYLGDSNTYQGQYQQEANEKEVCNFIASLVENNYDEYGEVVLPSPEWELSRWKEINAYRQDIAQASPLQVLGILFSVGLCAVLSIYIVYLRYKLTRRLPWSRGFGASKEAALAGTVGRTGSGITMQRSLSNLEPGFSESFN